MELLWCITAAATTTALLLFFFKKSFRAAASSSSHLFLTVLLSEKEKKKCILDVWGAAPVKPSVEGSRGMQANRRRRNEWIRFSASRVGAGVVQETAEVHSSRLYEKELAELLRGRPQASDLSSLSLLG